MAVVMAVVVAVVVAAAREVVTVRVMVNQVERLMVRMLGVVKVMIRIL